MASFFTGVRADIKLNGRSVGYCTGLSFSIEVARAKVYPIGEKDPIEAVYIGNDVGPIRASVMRITDEDLASAGIMPGGGASLESIIKWPRITLEVSDKANGGKILHLIEGVYVVGGSWDIAARGLVGQDVDMIGLSHKFGSEVN